MKLYICEKPSQAKDLAPHVGAIRRGEGKIDGNAVCVTWCIGHLLEQASPDSYDPALKAWRLDSLPVLPSAWQMNVKDKTRSQFVIIKSLLKSATEVVIATDADREGEVIAREVMQLCGYRGAVSRLWLSALDSASIKKALSKLKTGRETLPLYLSGLGRARADWLAGMNLTMALTSGFGSGGKTGVMHCGRVQTPVLALIVRRERAITAFRSHAYFEGQVDVVIHNQTVTMQWIAPAEALDKDGHIQNRATVQARRVLLPSAMLFQLLKKRLCFIALVRSSAMPMHGLASKRRRFWTLRKSSTRPTKPRATRELTVNTCLNRWVLK
jgi:DNA topoisomerase III